MSKPQIAWGVFRKSDGKLMWWYDNKDRWQYDVFVRRSEARASVQEWLKAGEICVVRKVRLS